MVQAQGPESMTLDSSIYSLTLNELTHFSKAQILHL